MSSKKIVFLRHILDHVDEAINGFAAQSHHNLSIHVDSYIVKEDRGGSVFRQCTNIHDVAVQRALGSVDAIKDF